MNWLWIAGGIMVAIVAAEAVFILSDKMPWNRRKKK